MNHTSDFFWQDLDVNQRPTVHEFERLVFGDASAPFRAQYVAQENAQIRHDEFRLAAETMKESTYMDDTLDSVKMVVSAIRL